MIAIATYAIPTSDRSAAGGAMRKLGSAFRPYVLLTSQWQQWNLFAPEPTRRSVTYRVETRTGEAWRELTRIEPASYSLWRRERQLTMFGRMLDPAERTYQPAFANLFLQSICETERLHAGTSIRMVRMIAVMPSQSQVDADALRGWTPDYVPSLGATISCQKL
jgi:hypothetical protein